MKRKTFRTLLVGGLLSASLAAGIAPSYAMIDDPTNAGISEADWASFVQLGDYNGALAEFVDDDGVPEMLFPKGSTAPDHLQYPAGWRQPTTFGLYAAWDSKFTSLNEISAVEDDAVTKIGNAGYLAGAGFNPEEDTVEVTTLAPSSVTAPLVTTYGLKITIVAGNLTAQSDGGATSHGSTKKHSAKKHARKHFAQKHASAKPVRKAPTPTPTPTGK
ncbi:hypothetical protein [Streptomyces sp. NBC_00582]|uniref:hypothetical protein n=1 Tax=Streptomyces sp. NBC_00582 TaxID=2975783 RepID=UPI001063244A|nr:hypothetical protein [Streptomyces sp. NBC_00582]WUB59312.1 hypothetical protein OG852_02255 [Streptomyces sp. NBC_00582]